MKEPKELYMNTLVPMVVEQTARRERDHGATAFSRSREPEKRNRHVHQLAGWRRHGRAGDLRHDAICASAHSDTLRRPGGLRRIAAPLRRRKGRARLPAELARFGAPALRVILRTGGGHRAACRGGAEAETAAERHLCPAHGPTA